MLDHIGFEVTNLEAVCRELEAKGVMFDVPYSESPEGVGTGYPRKTRLASRITVTRWGPLASDTPRSSIASIEACCPRAFG